MTGRAGSAALKRYRPEPSRWWITLAPVAWPGEDGLWTHLAERALGAIRLDAPWEIEGAEPREVVYVPPVRHDAAQSASAPAERLRAESLPLVTQCRVGEPGGEDVVLDPLSALVEAGAEGLDGMATECRSAVWPLIAGLTTAPALWDRGLDLLAAAGIEVVAPLVVDLTPADRRRLAESTDEAGYQALFHGPLPDEREFARVAAAKGLGTVPRRPVPAMTPRHEFRRRVATELLVIADRWLRLGRGEAAGQNLLRAARWVEDSDHDLKALAREGNLSVLPWLDETSVEVVADLAAGRPSALRRALEFEYSGGG